MLGTLPEGTRFGTILSLSAIIRRHSDIELEHGGGTLSQHGHNVCYGIVGQ
jgi:hypothetical protein